MFELSTSIRLDCPLGKKEAESRGIDHSLSRLLIGGECEVLVDLIHSCCPSNKATNIQAIGEFTLLERLLPEFNKSNIEVDSDNGFLSVITKDQINLVFSQWNAELLVVFFADMATASLIIDSLSSLQPKWWEFSREGYEAPYLKKLELVDPFFFFSHTRSSLEILGSKEVILKCFDNVRSKGSDII